MDTRDRSSSRTTEGAGAGLGSKRCESSRRAALFARARRPVTGSMGVGAALVTVATAVAISVALSLGLYGLAGSQAEEAAPGLGPDFGVEWDYQPADLTDLVANSPAIVLAQVTDVRDGAPLVASPSDSDAGVIPAVPTQRIDLHVVQAIDGQTPEDFTLFKLGGPGEQPEGSPRYEVGERDLLFVRPRLNDDGTAPNADGTWIAVAPDGRLEKLDSGELASPVDGPIADQLNGATVPEAVQAIDDAQAPPDPSTPPPDPAPGGSP